MQRMVAVPQEMERNMDLIRAIMLYIEADPRYDGHRGLYPSVPLSLGGKSYKQAEVHYHLDLLIQAGYIKGVNGIGNIAVQKLTWKGHEFLDDIRDDDIWAKTKERLSGISSVALSVVGALAEAEIKRKLGLP